MGFFDKTWTHFGFFKKKKPYPTLFLIGLGKTQPIRVGSGRVGPGTRGSGKNCHPYMCIGVRTANNYYGITPSISNKCFNAKINQVDLWHQRLGHASHKQLEKISKCDAVIGLPEFEKIEKCICGPCQIGK